MNRTQEDRALRTLLNAGMMRALRATREGAARPFTSQRVWGVGQIHVKAVDRHRNGVGGNGFYVVLFNTRTLGPMIGVLFASPTDPEADKRGYCAVLGLEGLVKGDIAFGSNSWRGDEFEPALRAAVVEFEERRAQQLRERYAKTQA